MKKLHKEPLVCWMSIFFQNEMAYHKDVCKKHCRLAVISRNNKGTIEFIQNPKCDNCIWNIENEKYIES